jgi:hypothetical protein
MPIVRKVRTAIVASRTAIVASRFGLYMHLLREPAVPLALGAPEEVVERMPVPSPLDGNT